MNNETTSPRIIVAGGGNATDSLPLDELLARWTGKAGRLLYLPVALAGMGKSYADCLEWITSALNPRGIADITMWTDLSQFDYSDLNRFDAVYIGGGNTFTLLAQMRTTGFDKALTDFILRGGIVYGGSAGAIVLGHNILTCAHLDTNQTGLTEMGGLDVLNGTSIWCHYHPTDDASIIEFVQRYNCAVLAIPERAGASFEGDQVTAFGYEPIRLFTVDDCQIINVGNGIVKDECFMMP